MPSFSVKQDEDILTIIERSIMPFPINEREMEIFAKYQLSCLFKPVLEKRNRIKYTAPISVPLSGFIRSDMNEHKLFGLLTRIMDTVTILEQYDLAVSNLVLNENMIFINEMTENIFLIYRPLNDGSSGGNIYRFLDNLVLKIRKQNRSISDECDDFHAFLLDPNHYKVSEIIDYINMVYPSIFREIKKPEISDKGDTFRLRNRYEDNSATSFLNTEDKQHEENNEHQKKTIFKIISTDNLISFDINKDVYVIGKSKERADGVIFGNSMISRTHAEITITDNHAYIKDLNSANGTFIDGGRLESGKSEPLYKNSIIKLADMEFIISDTESFFKGNKITQKILFMDMEYICRDFDIAYETARKLAQNDNSKILFVSTDMLQGAGYLINIIKTMTSDTITALKTDKRNIFRNAMHCLIHDGNIDLFPVFPGPLWEYDINKDFYSFMIKEAVDTEIYDYIVVDNHEWDVFTLLTAPKDKAFIISGKNDYSKRLAESVKNHSDNELNVMPDDSFDEVYKKICQIL